MPRQIPAAIAEAMASLGRPYLPDLTAPRLVEVLSSSPEHFSKPSTPESFTIAEVCAASRLSRAKVARMLRNGELKCRRIGRCVRVPRPVLEELLAVGE